MDVLLFQCVDKTDGQCSSCRAMCGYVETGVKDREGEDNCAMVQCNGALWSCVLLPW